jgi:ubiquinone/menaquinone biosynthesis C-methylase UbiE
MHGVDISMSMISCARGHLSGYEIPFEVLSAEMPLALPYPKEKFDAVIASSVLEYVSNPLECFKELGRVCKPDGVLILSVPNMFHPRRWLEAALRILPIRTILPRGSKGQLYLEYLDISRNRFRVKDWSHLLSLAGWQLQYVRASKKASCVRSST